MEINSRKIAIRNAVIVIILMMTLVFLFLEREQMTNQSRWTQYPKDLEQQSVSMLGNHVVSQSFVAQHSTIGFVSIRFDNPVRATSTGSFRLELTDSDGELVASTSISSTAVRSSSATKFILGGNSDAANANRVVQAVGSVSRTNTIKVHKGETYTLNLYADDITSEKNLDLMICTGTPDDDSSHPYRVSIDGTSYSDSWIRASVCYRKYSVKTILFFVLLILATLLFSMLPFESLDRRIANKRSGNPDHDGLKVVSGTVELSPNLSPRVWISRAMLLFTPLMSYFITQRFTGKTISGFIRQAASFKGLLNLFIIGMFVLLLYTIFNSVRASIIGTTLIFAFFGLVNYMMILFRDTPLIATDIVEIHTALQVAGSYKLVLNGYSLWSIVFTVIWCCAALSLGKYPGLPLRRRLIPLIATFVWIASFYYIFFESTVLDDHGLKVSGFRPKGSYTNNGNPLAFVITVRNSFVKKPDGYSPDAASRLAQNYPSDEATTPTVKDSPNIIIVMNEAYSDLAVLGEISTNEDYMPFYHRLKENTIKGWMSSSVIAGSTADTEFECLTGFSMAYLPFHSIPYRSVLFHETPSLAYYMQQENYGGITAFHPGMRDSYRRDAVYPLLGFKKHISLEDLDSPEKIRDFVSDSYDYQIVKDEYEALRSVSSDQPYFMFNVTIQNHGGYEYASSVTDAGILLTDDEVQEDSTLQFVNLIKYSDEALEELLTYFSNVDEDTIIILFGDHQPRLDSSFYSTMKKRYGSSSAIDWESRKYMVPFMIWANYDIEESQDFEISANYISSYIKQLAGLPLTGFDKYLLELRETLPIVSAICIRDSAGKLYDIDEPTPYDDLLNDYGILQYNGLIDYKNRVEGFFALK